MLGYWRDKEATDEAIDAEGWLHTADLARSMPDGYLRITGRIKDIIIRGGHNLSALEIENLVMDHPFVRSVAVVGYPDAVLGEKACAVVVLEPGTSLTLEELTSMMRERGIAAQKLPERLIVVDELPINVTGKVQKEQLRRLVGAS
jgi:non-ribosomal peptide synthetase component E (peptide arylation enzyme)